MQNARLIIGGITFLIGVAFLVAALIMQLTDSSEAPAHGIAVYAPEGVGFLLIALIVEMFNTIAFLPQ